MTSVMSFEQITNNIRHFEEISANDEVLVCPKAPTIKPMRFPNKHASLYFNKNIEPLRASAFHEK
jgi:hypothetical protein